MLARKYRPQNFAELVGQDILVRTLKNALESGQLPHAMLFTGVRGTGKTTTARLLARAVNYTGKDGNAGPSFGPTNDCETCKAIAAERHPDVVEMDAASRTGVDDVRELIENSRYRPLSARYKVYIIDEVHMLSTGAFNALLKTLEEPPPHVIFLFATTEVRKVPVTVLSRCMRFDLRRVSRSELAKHLADVAARENVNAEPEALAALARAAEGSVRDGLSLLDQAMAMTSKNVSRNAVNEMLGLADRNRIADLLGYAMAGNAPQTLETLRALHRDGANPESLLNDLLELAHAASIALVTEAGEVDGVESAVVTKLAKSYAMAEWVRCWQILLKGVYEVRTAPNGEDAIEMLLLRLVYASGLPDPATLVRRFKESVGAGGVGGGAVKGTAGKGTTATATATTETAAVSLSPSVSAESVSPSSATKTAAVSLSSSADGGAVSLETDEDLYAYLHAKGHMRLAESFAAEYGVRELRAGCLRLEARPTAKDAKELERLLMKILPQTRDKIWRVEIADGNAPTLREKRAAADSQLKAAAMRWPVVGEVMSAFPGSRIVSVERDKTAAAGDDSEQRVKAKGAQR
ncbi:MAG: DNA polymerase III subunit gamma/tau [Alphaproteobacteria bacterium]|nr:DNA polymerase III subunit gamma/tau [Alphaproteobacteria bacterium]MDA7982595.1 DNA polymerase III subunit gamma/tau [Alphaproteobacteria bacterium]